MKKIFQILLFVLIFSSQQILFAQENFQSLAEKQTYMTNKMQSYYAGKIKMTLTVPESWHREVLPLHCENNFAEKFSIERYENLNPENEFVLLHLHGGGYVMELTDTHRSFALKMADTLRVKELYSLNYRVAPKNPYPDALDDALQTYQLLLKKFSPKKILVMGDSAGGNLAVALCLALREKNLPQPAQVYLQSPWLNFERKNNASRKYNFKNDIILGKGRPLVKHVEHPSYAKNLKLNDKRISFIHADLTGLPPMLIQAGGYELLLSEAEEFALQAIRCNVPVSLTVYPYMSHDFTLFFDELQEGQQVFQETRDFFKRYQ